VLEHDDVHLIIVIERSNVVEDEANIYTSKEASGCRSGVLLLLLLLLQDHVLK
jgi:hypothetical protein